MRLFIAIDLPDAQKQEVSFRAKDLQMLGGDIRWTPVSNLHLTIQFLGEIEAAKVSEIQSALRAVASQTKPFLVRLESLGAFPNIDDPQVLWVGVGDGEKSLSDLEASVNTAMRSLGLRAERQAFKPHVTFGRSRSRRNEGALSEALINSRYQSRQSFLANELVLFESVLGPDATVYKKIGQYPLAI